MPKFARLDLPFAYVATDQPSLSDISVPGWFLPRREKNVSGNIEIGGIGNH